MAHINIAVTEYFNESAFRHNRQVLDCLTPGDLIENPRGSFSHWAVYVGNGMVVHLVVYEKDGVFGKVLPEHVFTLSGRTFRKSFACLHRLARVFLLDASKIYINNAKDTHWCPLDRDVIVETATSLVGPVEYNLVSYNCEHFAKWCRYNKVQSDQTDNVLTAIKMCVA